MWGNTIRQHRRERVPAPASSPLVRRWRASEDRSPQKWECDRRQATGAVKWERVAAEGAPRDKRYINRPTQRHAAHRRPHRRRIVPDRWPARVRVAGNSGRSTTARSTWAPRSPAFEWGQPAAHHLNGLVIIRLTRAIHSSSLKPTPARRWKTDARKCHRGARRPSRTPRPVPCL